MLFGFFERVQGSNPCTPTNNLSYLVVLSTDAASQKSRLGSTWACAAVRAAPARYRGLAECAGRAAKASLGQEPGANGADRSRPRRLEQQRTAVRWLQHTVTVHLAPRLRHDPQVWPRRLPTLGVNALRLIIRDRAGDDHVLAVLPVHGRRNPVLGGELQGVDHPDDLVEVAARRHRINQDELDLLVGPDDEDVADGLVVRRGTPVRGAADARR